MDEENQRDEKSGLPDPEHGAWRIELNYLPIGPRGHLFFTLVNPNGEPVQQLHGRGQSTNTDEIMDLAPDGSKLVAGEAWMSPKKTVKIGEVAVGPYSEVVKGRWARGLEAAKAITQLDLDYKSDDLSYELFGGKGGEIQNSNSVAYTHSKAMAVDAQKALDEANMERRFPGWGRDLLERNYKPYVAPGPYPNVYTP